MGPVPGRCAGPRRSGGHGAFPWKVRLDAAACCNGGKCKQLPAHLVLTLSRFKIRRCHRTGSSLRGRVVPVLDHSKVAAGLASGGWTDISRQL
jgi:hypothetical protein